jgi:hypothetical protein
MPPNALTGKGAEPFSLLEVDSVRSQMLLDRCLSQRLSDFALEKNVEAGHATLSRDPSHSRLAVQLKGDDLRAGGKVGIQERVQHSPNHLGLCASEADAQGVPHKRPRTISTNSVLALDLAT